MFTEMKNLFYRLVNRQDIFEKRNFELENTTETSKTAKKKKEKTNQRNRKDIQRFLGQLYTDKKTTLRVGENI